MHRAWRRIALALVLALAPLTGAIGQTSASDAGGTVSAGRAAEVRQRTFDAVLDVFATYYWDPAYTDWTAWADRYRDRALAAPSRAAFDGVLRRMIDDLGDDHSRWLGSSEPTPEGPSAPTPPALGFAATPLPGRGAVVERVYAGTPAARAGLARGDVVVAIDGAGVANLSASEISHRIDRAAREGGGVFEIQRARTSLQIRIDAERFDLEAAAEGPTATRLSRRTGLVYVPAFTGSDTARAVARLLDAFVEDGVDGLVLDLRGNPGGRLTEMGLVLGAFVDGPLAEAEGRGRVQWRAVARREDRAVAVVLERPDGTRVAQSAADPVPNFGGELVVLVDERTSSAGELAAAILRHSGRARVVGVPTSGNVEAVQRFGLPDGSAVMVAVADMRAADGTSFSEGIVPDVVSRVDLWSLARGYDAPVAEALRLLEAGPFRPGRFF